MRHVVAVVVAVLVVGATGAGAVTRFVDGACATSGTGTSLTCGATGPFRTIAEGTAVNRQIALAVVAVGEATIENASQNTAETSAKLQEAVDSLQKIASTGGIYTSNSL